MRSFKPMTSFTLQLRSQVRARDGAKLGVQSYEVESYVTRWQKFIKLPQSFVDSVRDEIDVPVQAVSILNVAVLNGVTFRIRRQGKAFEALFT